MDKKYDRIFFPLASLSFIVGLFLKFRVYRGLGSKFFVTMLGVVFINSLLAFFMKKPIYNRKNFIMLTGFLGIFLAGQIYSMPRLSYRQAEALVKDYGKGTRLESPFDTSLINDGKDFPEAYLFKLRIDGEEEYILVDAKSGEIVREKVGDSYIDRAIELKN